AVEEIAAEHGQTGEVITAADIHKIATEIGFDSSPRDVVRLDAPIDFRNRGQTPAWVVGREVARALRTQLRLEAEPVSDDRLGEMGGIRSEAIQSKTVGPSISFAFDEKIDRSKVVLRSKWRTGRRFEFARLLGDRVANRSSGKLFPATRAYTYRQK